MWRAARTLVVLACLLPAVALTLLRVFTPTWPPAVMATAFVPYAIPLYVLALIVLVIAWRTRRTRRIPVVAAGVAVLLGIHLWWASGPYLGADQVPPGPRLRVMNINAHVGTADASQILATAREHRVGLLVIEELTDDLLDRLAADGLRKSFPYAAGTAGSGATGTMVFSTFPLPGWLPLGIPLGGVVANVESDTGGFTLVAAHPTRPHLTQSSRWLDDHATILATVKETTGPLVLVGDLNATPDHAPLRALEAAGLRDSVDAARAGFKPTWPANRMSVVPGPEGRSLIAIDHVMVNDDWRVAASTTVRIDGTDHRAVIATIVHAAR